MGAFELLDVGEGLLGYRRTVGGDDWTVVVNFTDVEVAVDDGTAELSGHQVELSSDGAGEGRPFGGRIGPDQAVVLRR